MDHNVISLGGVVVTEFKQISEKFGVFRMMCKHSLDKDSPLFIEVACFDRLSEICHEYVKKRTQVHVSGRLRLKTREYEGRKINDYSIVAQTIDFSNTFSGELS
jgi:single-stranded DNA-binding protein